MSRRRQKASRVAASGAGRLAAAWVARSAAIVLLVASGVIAYANSFAGVFVLDDEPAVALNENLRSLMPLTRALTAPPDSTLSGRPVATLTFAIDTAVRGGTLTAYHQTNLAIHLLASLCVFGVVRRTLNTVRLRDRLSGESTWLAFAVALLFVVHPLQTSAVTYIVQRVESLAGLLILAAVYAAIRSTEARGRASMAWGAFAVVACASAMGTKETAVGAPLLVVLWDRLFLEDRPPHRRMLLAALFSTWAILALLVAAAPRGLSAGFGFEEWPWWRYLLTQAPVIVHYVRLAFVPNPLVFDYGLPAATLAEATLPGLVIVAAIVMAVRLTLARHPLAFPLASFFVLLAPSSSVVPIVTEVAAEHRMYLPLAGVLSILVIGPVAVWKARQGGFSPGVRRGVAAAGLLALVMAAATLGRLTFLRNDDYRDYDRLWSKTVAERPENPRARINLASSFLTQGRYKEAEEHSREAVRLAPRSAEAQANLGVALAAQGRAIEGIPPLERAIELAPDFLSARRNLAEALAVAGEFDRALLVARAAVSRAKALGQTRIASELEARAADYARDAGRPRP